MPQRGQEFQPSNEQFFQAHDSISTIVALKEPDLIRAHVDKLFPKVRDLLFEYLITVDPELNQRPYEPIAVALWTDLGHPGKVSGASACSRENGASCSVNGWKTVVPTRHPLRIPNRRAPRIAG